MSNFTATFRKMSVGPYSVYSFLHINICYIDEKYKQRKLTFFAAFSVQQTTGTTATEEQDKKNDYHGNSDAKR